MNDCVCMHDETPCSESHEDGWTCTRPEGHSGEHVACGMTHNIASWESELTDKLDLLTALMHLDMAGKEPMEEYEHHIDRAKEEIIKVLDRHD